jgi:hypothetical protein
MTWGSPLNPQGAAGAAARPHPDALGGQGRQPVASGEPRRFFLLLLFFLCVCVCVCVCVRASMGARLRCRCTLRRLRLDLALAALLSEFHGIVRRLPGMPVGWCATAADAGWPESWPTSPLPLPCPPCPRASHLGGHCLSSSSQRSCPLLTAAHVPATHPSVARPAPPNSHTQTTHLAPSRSC